MSAGSQDLQRRKYETEEEKEELVPQLREVSRQEYLKKREAQRIAELEDALRDEELLFACVSCPSLAPRMGLCHLRCSTSVTTRSGTISA